MLRIVVETGPGQVTVKLEGSLAGPWVARRLPPGVLRWLVALTGLALAIRLWLDPAG